MASCNKGEVYYKFEPIPNNEWGREQKLTFLLYSVAIISNMNDDVSLDITHNSG